MDIYFARQLVFERLQAAKEQLPDGVEPEMGPISTGLGEIYQYTLESDRRSPMELRTMQDWFIAPQLRSIAGVNEVNSFGGFVKQYHVLVDPARLLKYRLTLQDVLEALQKNNANAGGNFLTQGWEQAYVRSVGLIQTIEDIEDIVLHAKDGTPVFLKDVAEVKIGPQTRQGAVTQDGRGETVAGMAIMLRGSNSKIVVDSVKKAIPEIQASLPEGCAHQPVLRPHGADPGLHRDRGEGPAGGRAVCGRRSLPPARELPRRADRGAVAAVHRVHHVHPDGLAGRHGESDEPGRAGHRHRHGRGRLHRRCGEHRAPSLRAGRLRRCRG